ncbi:MAG: DNA repair protein RecN [Deltaproteobacteria bacterium]|nr:DNA repair protein RecN [Deltaproteobacteria bacterium]
MLKTIYIKNFATIDYLEIDFSEGLNVLSGETGAGKSIIIESINFLFGKTKGSDIIRTDSGIYLVSAVFDAGEGEGIVDLTNIFEECGAADILNSEDIILKRTISESGKSKYFINNEQVNKNIPERIGENLVKIFGQNDRRFLIESNSQLAFLDNFAGNQDLLTSVKKIYGGIKRIEAEKSEIAKKIDGISRAKTINSYITGDVEKLGIKSKNDEEILKEELKRLENINGIKEFILSSIDLIDNEEYGILKHLNPLISNLSKLSELDSNFKQKEELKNAETVKILLDDILLSLEKYSSVEFDEEKLSEIKLKIDGIIGIENKYGVSNLEELLKIYDEAKKELGGISELERRIAEIDAEYKNLKEKFLKSAEELHTKRLSAASVLEKEIETELLFLGIKPVFKIKLTMGNFEEGFSETGLDECIFMFSANPGEDPRPLSKVASGGELSRVSLCILKIMNKKKDAASFVFDEIDAGIGGDIANFVGEALKSISNVNQVILITHLAQVSSFADKHFFVYKDIEGGKTYTKIKSLSMEERVGETARMLSGDSKGEAALRHAKEILKRRGFVV